MSPLSETDKSSQPHLGGGVVGIDKSAPWSKPTNFWHQLSWQHFLVLLNSLQNSKKWPEGHKFEFWGSFIQHFLNCPASAEFLPILPQGTLADLCCLMKVYSTQKLWSLKFSGIIFCEITNGSNVSSSKCKIQKLNFIIVSSTKFEIQIFYLQNVSWAKLFKMQNWNIIFSNCILSEIILNARFKSCICK